MRILTLPLFLSANATIADVPTAADTENTPRLSVWRLTDGNDEHMPPSAPCPSTLTDYRRQSAMAFERFGLDIGCNNQNGSASLTYDLSRREVRAAWMRQWTRPSASCWSTASSCTPN